MSETSKRGATAGRLMLLGVSLAMAALLVAGAEGLLRVAGIGERDESRLAYQRVYPPVLEAAGDFLRTADRRLPHQVIRAQKPHNALRVITFGASATAGLGFGPNVTFSRNLERLLVAAYPERSVEVLNLGIVAVPSSAVRRLVEDACRHYKPDALVVYAGNNEFMELHSAKYSDFHATPLTRIRDSLLGLNLARLLNGALRGRDQGPTLAQQAASQADVRGAERTIMRDIQISDSEIEEVLDSYERNLGRMVAAAKGTQTPLLLSTVASNWRWQGRSDLGTEWLDSLLGEAAAPTPERYQRAITLLDERLEKAARSERHGLLYKRAMAAEALGDIEAVRRDLRAALNVDPHLRRALEAGNARVQRVAERHSVALADVAADLAAQAPDEIIGFDEFYDNVHFTPRGAMVVAQLFFDALQQAGFAPPSPGFDSSAFAEHRIREVEARTRDPLELGEWMGFGFDTAQLIERDPWKYDRLQGELDARIEKQPDDFSALVYRANARYFRLDGATQAEADYRAALALRPNDERVRANLSRLLSEARR